MGHINVEIKAKSDNHDFVRETIRSRNAIFKGVDHQIDTYFNVSNGRLKLRDGVIENHLIQYQRKNESGPKQSDIVLFKSDTNSSLKEILTNALGILAIIEKKREIYFIDNVKFHIDTVQNLGTFIEIEAIDYDGTIGKDKLCQQCHFFLDLLKINERDMISLSYSDLYLQK